MDTVYQLANESKLNFNVPKVPELHKVWSALWDQCEDANESLGQKTCFPKPNNKGISNVLKMLTVFQNELKRRGLDSRVSYGEILRDGQCEGCGLGRSQERLLEDGYGRRGKTNEYSLSQPNSPSKVGYRKQPPNELYAYEEELDNEEPRGRKGRVPKTTAFTKQRSPYPQERETRTGLDSRASYGETLSDDQCEGCGLSRSQERLLDDGYGRRGKMNEYSLSQPNSPSKVGYGKQPPNELYAYEEELDNEEPRGSKGRGPNSTAFTKQRSPYPQERETRSMENPTNELVQLLPNFTKYDPNKDPFTTMGLFEDECTQHNLGRRESCLMMKLWLPSHMAVRLTSPVARPAGGSQFWSSDSHWGDKQDRLKALAFLATGEDTFGIDILEDLKVTPKDDPWEFARKFEQVYRLVTGVKDTSLPPAMLKALLNKFTFLNCATRTAASKERTVDGIVRIVDKYRRNPCVDQMGMMMMDQFSTPRYQRSMAETPVRLWSQLPQDTSFDTWSSQPQNVRSFSEERPEDLQVEGDETGSNWREDDSVLESDAGDPDISEDPTVFSRNAVQ